MSEEFLTEERDFIKIKLIFKETGLFELENFEEFCIISKMLKDNQYRFIVNLLDLINSKIIDTQTLKIDESSVIRPPDKKLWHWIYFSIVLIVISFFFEILPVYYSIDNSLAYLGLSLILISLGIIIAIIISQFFFLNETIERVIKSPSYMRMLKEVVNPVLSESTLFNEDESVKIEYNNPLELEFIVNPR